MLSSAPSQLSVSMLAGFVPQMLNIICNHSWLMSRQGNLWSSATLFMATECAISSPRFYSLVWQTWGQGQAGAVPILAPRLQGMKLRYLMMCFKPIWTEKRDITPKWFQHTPCLSALWPGASGEREASIPRNFPKSLLLLPADFQHEISVAEIRSCPFACTTASNSITLLASLFVLCFQTPYRNYLFCIPWCKPA